MYEDLTTLTEKFRRPYFKCFKTSFLDVLQHKFVPATHDPLDGTASKSYNDDDPHVNQKVELIAMTRLTFNRK